MRHWLLMRIPLALAVTLQRLQPVAGRHTKVVDAFGGIDQHQLTQGNRLNVRWKPPHAEAPPDPLGVVIRETPDHAPP
jgi:hypothetical protein